MCIKLRAILMLQGPAMVAQLLPLLRFLQAAGHHASKPAEPEHLIRLKDFGLSPAPTESAGPATDAALGPQSSAHQPASAPGAAQAAAASAGADVEAAAEAGAAAGPGPGLHGADLAPVAVTGTSVVQRLQESGESEVEDMDEDEDEFLDEEMDDEGNAGATYMLHLPAQRCLTCQLHAVKHMVDP